MNFYKEWQECCNQNLDDTYYINSFLAKSVYSIESLEKCKKKDLKDVVDFLIQYDKRKILEYIDDRFIKIVNTSEIVQFSSLEASTTLITHKLYYEKNPLTFEEIGYLINKPKSKVAAVKYGENQSKTAYEFSLVSINDGRSKGIKNTVLGNYFPFLDENSKKKLLSILSLRNPFTLTLIAKSKNKPVFYMEEATCLTLKTRDRRISNSKKMVDLAFYENEDLEYYKNIKFDKKL